MDKKSLFNDELMEFWGCSFQSDLILITILTQVIFELELKIVNLNIIQIKKDFKEFVNLVL